MMITDDDNNCDTNSDDIVNARAERWWIYFHVMVI